MELLLGISVTLVVAVLVSALAHRSVLSTAVMFLVAGFFFGEGGLHWFALTIEDPIIQTLAELALFSVLFTDGMQIGLKELTSAWRLPGRALILGMPLTMVLIALSSRLLLGLDWLQAFLLGAALSPTDPVFAAAVVGRAEIPFRLRHLLNVESGLNDGLALPVVLALIAALSHSPNEVVRIVWELILGVALGLLIPLVMAWLEQSRFFQASQDYEALFIFSVGLLLLSLCKATHANEFLAAFTGGITVATISPQLKMNFHEFGELITELLKLSALFVFGGLLSPAFFTTLRMPSYVLVAVILFVVRPLAIGTSLIKSGLGVKENLVAAWYGPRGFASVVYGLIIFKAPFEGSYALFHLIGLVTAVSIILHSSTDILVVKYFRNTQERTPSENASILQQ
jgi:NhaP-type Na+/H+ or K+/H+ antiporter